MTEGLRDKDSKGRELKGMPGLGPGIRGLVRCSACYCCAGSGVVGAGLVSFAGWSPGTAGTD